MDTNFSLNLLLVLILTILYCFRDSDSKNENFKNYSIDNFQETVKGEEDISDLNKRFNNLEKKYKSSPAPINNNKMEKIQNQLIEAQKEAELEAEKSTSNISNKKKKSHKK
jgi:hypothetical protein